MNDYGQISRSSTLRPAAYQLVPLIKMMTNGFGSVLISDGVGVGKTISSGYILLFYSQTEMRPSMVVCPPGLVDKWYFELTSKFDLKAATLRSPGHIEVASAELDSGISWKRPSTYIMSNSLLRNQDLSTLKNLSVIVFDEIHNYRNQETRGHQGALELARSSSCRVGLSATPINNKLEDLSSEINILMPEHDWDTINSVVQDTWHLENQILSKPLTTRFTKERLGIHFAERVVDEYHVSYSDWYYEWVQDLLSQRNLSQTGQKYSFENITLYRLASSCPKAFSKAVGVPLPQPYFDQKIELFLSVLDSSRSSHIIVFCEFKETAFHLSSNINGRTAFEMTGDTPLFERTAIIERFRKSDNAVMILTSVGSEGLDMQFADTIINYDLHWNPMKLEQRIGRIDRVGQLKSQISIVNFVVSGSIDERVKEVLHEKLKIVLGSIFEPNRIVSTGKRAGSLLLDQEIMVSELEQGRGLISALEWASRIPEFDYDILDAIDTRFCSPEEVVRAAETRVWLNDLMPVVDKRENWLSEMQACAERLRETLTFYS